MEDSGSNAAFLLLYEHLWNIHEKRCPDRATAWKAAQRLLCPRVLFEKQGDAWVEIEIPSTFRKTFADGALMRLRTRAAGIIQVQTWQRKTLAALEEEEAAAPLSLSGFLASSAAAVDPRSSMDQSSASAASPRSSTSVLARVRSGFSANRSQDRPAHFR